MDLRTLEAFPAFLTCEAVLTEAALLLKRDGHEADALFELLERGVIRVGLNVQTEQSDLQALMLADACMVRLSELHPQGEIFTLDSDFRFYRRYGNKVIPALLPD